MLNCERFCDRAPAEVWATLLDEGIYLASVATFYRLLRERQQVRERQRIARHLPQAKPELVATGPNQVWSWDITKPAGPYEWTWFQLYVILDVYSRYVVGWLVAARESATLAEGLIADAIYRHELPAGQLTIHADRGSSMTSKTVSQLLCDLGVLQSHSRPHQSNDNPYSESQFKMRKYCPSFPRRLANFTDARAFCSAFFPYNEVRPHRGIGRRSPAEVYAAREKAVPSASFVKVGERRLRFDRVDKAGRVTLRHRGRLHHIGIGNAYAGWRVAMLIDGLKIEIVALDGSPLRRLVLDTTKDYQRIP